MKLRYQLASALAGLAAVSTVAAAQPAPDSPPPPAPPPAADPALPPPPPPQPVGTTMMPPPGGPGAQPVDPHAGVDKGTLDDAASSSSFFTPTALTAPAGTFWFSDVDLLLITAGYAFTNELQLSATTLVPVTSDFPLWVVLNGKYQFLKQGRLRLAAQGALLIFGLSDDTTDGNGNTTSSTKYYFAGDVGGAGTLCFDDNCGSHASLFVGAGFAADSSQQSVPLAVGASIVGKVSKHVRVIGEVDTGYIVGKINDTSNTFLVSYGLRFTSRNIGVDFGFTKPFVDGDSTGDALPLGIPYLGFTYRGLDD